MNAPQGFVSVDDTPETLTDRFARIRSITLALCESMQVEDFVVQSMPDVSPTKWHLAHVTWFFEKFVLKQHAENYRCYNDDFDFLFNSYYYTAGKMHARPERGLLTRPTVQEVRNYRRHVDAAMQTLLRDREDEKELCDLVTLGLNHEQQHQELLLTDIKHVLSCNPLQPALYADLPAVKRHEPAPFAFSEGKSGICEIGAAGVGFCFDNETPRHRTLVHPHLMGERLVTNGEFLAFIADGGYAAAELWLSDGWATINRERWLRPLYWSEDLQSEFTLGGRRDIDPSAPVTHVSYYEADAYARWAGARLPTEAEWDVAASDERIKGNFLQSGFLHPVPGNGGKQFFGDVWEWTSSAYSPYPGFTPLAGSLGEYNGKFMCNQVTVRGGSCVTSIDHIRASYRSFFYADARWQFLGIRLAKDLKD
jgi:ergothioneine biosynthesis protein EgtB